MDFIIGMVTGMVVTAFAVYLIFKYMERRVMAELVGRSVAEKLEADKPDNIVATVEVADNQYFCYNKDNSQFLCYGTTLTELVSKFRERFPDRGITLESDSKEITEELYRQYQQTKD
jgi:Na+-transporting methylmalonyl-CoA/oxaloacetate decarboxylase gamma subunit